MFIESNWEDRSLTKRERGDTTSEKMDPLKTLLSQSKMAFEETGRGDGSLAIEADGAEYLLELCADGKLLCQFGVDLDELRGMISGGTTEDLSDDELQRSAREHLRPIVTKYRGKLIAAGVPIICLCAPLLFRYSRIIWMHLDRTIDPGEK